MFGYSYDDGLNRSGWKAISDAALSRQTVAIGNIDEAIVNTTMDLTDWTMVIPATVHLVGMAWQAVRRYAIAKGFKIKRVAITATEKAALKPSIQRRGKMYQVLIMKEKKR